MEDHQKSAGPSPQDCLPCRVMGATVFTGIGLYTAWEGNRQLQKDRASIVSARALRTFRVRQAGIVGIATTMVGLGVYRAIM